MLKVGLASTDITPPVGCDLSGYSSRQNPSIGVHDKLYAKALVAGDETKKLCLITCDLVGLDCQFIQSVRWRIREQTGIDERHIMISASHTHSAPASMYLRGCGEVNWAWMEILRSKIAHAVQAACTNMRAAKIGAAETKETLLSYNRHYGEGGPKDDTLGVIKVEDTDGEPMGIVFNFNCHPVILGHENRLVSADYPGVTMRLLEEVNPNAVAMFINGTAGDVNPKEELRGSFAKMETYGRHLAESVSELLQKIECALLTEINAKIRIVDVPLIIPTTEEAKKILAEKREDLQSAQNENTSPEVLRWRRIVVEWAEEVLKRIKDKEVNKSIAVELQVLRINDILIAGIPGEVYTEIGLEIKAHSPFKHTYIVGTTNGNIGYIPSQKAAEKGGYGTSSGDAFKIYSTFAIDDREVEGIITGNLNEMISTL